MAFSVFIPFQNSFCVVHRVQKMILFFVAGASEISIVILRGGRANPVVDRKVVGVVFSGVAAMVAVVTPPQLLDVVWCSAVVVVVVVVYCSVK